MRAKDVSDPDNESQDDVETPIPSWKSRFFTIWSGQSASLFGSALVQFALVWWITLETRSATMLAVAFIAALVPQIAVGPFAGAIVDRSDRKRVMILADGGIALATVVLIVLFWLGAVAIWQIIALLIVRSVGGAFHWPAFQATVTLMVPKDQLPRVNGLNQAVFGLANIGGPAAGAVLLVLLPMQGILAVDVITALIAVSTLLAIQVPNPERGPSAKQNFIRDMKDGFAFVRGWPGALLLISVAAIINFLFTPTDALLPILTLDHFGGGAEEFAVLQVSIGVGMIAGGLLLGAWGGFKRRMLTVCFALALCGLSLMGIGLVPSGWYFAAVGSIFAAGVFISIVNGALTAVMQSVIPANMQGRVFALMSSSVMSMTPLGLAIGGPTADMLGPQAWFLIAGLASALIGAMMAFVPTAMKLDSSVPAGSRELSEA